MATPVFVTAISSSGSGAGALVTYTGANTFTAGDKITVSGATTAGYNTPNVATSSVAAYFSVNTATSTQFTVKSTATGTSSTAVAELVSTVTKDITEDLQYDLTRPKSNKTFELTNVSYDVSIADIGFVISANNQNKYQRQTAQYRKDQFDASTEPGEQTLLGWWLRSQTSWHHGAGIKYFEPGLDATHITHRFKDSRGVDIWTIGQVGMLNDCYTAYTDGVAIRAAAAYTGTTECLVNGDSTGALKKILLPAADGGSMTTTSYVSNSLASHSSYPFKSITADGDSYYAACSRAIHKGSVTTDADTIMYHYNPASDASVYVKYEKGYLWAGIENVLWLLDTTHTSSGANPHTAGSTDLNTGNTLGSKTHINTKFNWTAITSGPSHLYAAGNTGKTGEIWSIGFNDTTFLPDVAGAEMVASLPFGETINCLKYYLGYLCVATNKGIRICEVDLYGTVTLSPLLFPSDYDVTDVITNEKFVYASTTVLAENGATHAILIRVDLSTAFDDGTFPWAYDLEYDSGGASRTGQHVYHINDRMVINAEGGSTGELVLENPSLKRSSGYIETGLIRYATAESKFFKYLRTNAYIGSGDSIGLQTVDYLGNRYDIATLTGDGLGNDIELKYPNTPQESLGLRFTFTNASPNIDYPILESYQLKSLPAAPRQRLIQYPLSCFDLEMDNFNIEFGYRGRSYDALHALELLEETGDFVLVQDYRTDEVYNGIIESVEFFNESSSDKNNVGFGGMIMVTVRKF